MSLQCRVRILLPRDIHTVLSGLLPDGLDSLTSMPMPNHASTSVPLQLPNRRDFVPDFKIYAEHVLFVFVYKMEFPWFLIGSLSRSIDAVQLYTRRNKANQKSAKASHQAKSAKASQADIGQPGQPSQPWLMAEP
ncbi:hypothetical protein NE237_013676 [Protea cynaroides]|uniref:Uncharacterized protein n=1 Tax=Protea cynaroides TaxID=273540 RepID=A0A9Q0GZT0_9MAGN|nr:hypothetical protein NE237_013676 [Protea cynaroides]